MREKNRRVRRAVKRSVEYPCEDLSSWSKTMRIAYWTIDEVNFSLACDWAGAHDMTIDQVTWQDIDPTQDRDAVLYDLDSLPTATRAEILSCLVLSALPLPVAVHSYNLEDSQIELFVACGVAVYRRLESEVFGNLRDAVLRARS